jgi:hypothetical protein
MSGKAEIEIVLSNGNRAGKTINELTAQSVKLNREIKKMEIGSQEYVEATEEFKKVNTKLKETRNEIYGVSKAQSDLNNKMTEFLPFSSQINKFVKGFQSLSTGIKATTFSTRAFGIALAATGIGLIVIALGQLVAMFLKTQEGMDIVTRYTRPLVAMFQSLKGLAQELGGTIFKGLAQILKGDIAEGFRTMAGGVKDAAGSFTEVAASGLKAGQEIDRLSKQIEIRQNEMILSQSRLNRAIAEQSEIAKDVGKSEAERAAAAQKAIDLIAQRVKEEDDLLAMQIKKLEIEQSLNDTDREGMAEMNRLIAQRETLQAEAARERVRLTSVVNRTANDGEKTVTTTHKTEVDKRLKEEEDYARAVAKADQDLADLRITLMTDETQRKEAQLKIAAEREIENFKGTEEQKAQFAILRSQQLSQELEALRKVALQKELDTEIESEEIRRAQIEESFYNFLISEEEREQQLYELKRRGLQDRLDLIKSIHGEESLEYQRQFGEIAKLDFDQNQKRIDEAKRFAEAKSQLEQQSFQVFNDVVNGTLSLLGKEEEGRKKNIGAIKTFKAAQIKASYLAELASIWETSNANPGNILFPGTGNILAIAKTAAASVRFASGIKDVMSLKYALGGRVNGPSHAMGGVPFAVKGSPIRHEMEGGEIIMTKGVGQNPELAAAASIINQLGGGRSFAMGGPVSPTNAQTNPSTIINNLASPDRMPEVIQELQALRSEVNSWQKSFKVQLSLQQIREADETLKAVEMDTFV